MNLQILAKGIQSAQALSRWRTKDRMEYSIKLNGFRSPDYATDPMKTLRQRGVISLLDICSLPVSAANLYVNLNGGNPTYPYAMWSTAATNIQEALNAANPGDVVTVTDGVYTVGSETTSDVTMDRVEVANPVTLNCSFSGNVSGRAYPNTTGASWGGGAGGRPDLYDGIATGLGLTGGLDRLCLGSCHLATSGQPADSWRERRWAHNPDPLGNRRSGVHDLRLVPKPALPG